jgi:hypothetical protein
MTDNFVDPPPRPIKSKDVESWKLQLNDIIIKEINKALDALIEELNAGPLTGHSKAKRRVEHEIKRLTNLLTAIGSGLART